MKAGYYWPTVFNDCYSWVKKCKKCAFFTGKERLAALPLRPISVNQPFMQWGLDFIGVINPNSSQGHKWIVTATDYFTKWTEAVVLKEANESNILDFYEGIVTRFGAPATIISDNALAFLGTKITEWAVKNCVYLSTSSNYYPQGNGQAESTNKNLLRIIRRTLDENQRTWHTKLKSALWADRITPKRSTGSSPYKLVYGKEAVLPISLDLPALELMKQLELAEFEPMEIRHAELMELEETREHAMQTIKKDKALVKKSFDKKAKARILQIGDLVLKWDADRAKPGKHSKFDAIWSGPYMIIECK
ncbi:hypothetical protein KI387_044665, partial [Taxus chinensis]